jgi:pimeloyl-ACP methyl ester carboxylesterase
MLPILETTDGARLAYERRGGGRRLYVCNGGPANDYRYLADDLTSLEDELEIIFHDYRGSGRSSPAPQQTYTF